MKSTSNPVKEPRLISSDGVGGPILWTLKRSRRRSYGVRIHRDGRVEVLVPLSASPRAGALLIEEKREWILKKLRDLKKLPPPVQEPVYREGGIFFFLGESFPLAVKISHQKKVVLEALSLVVYTPDISREKVIRKQLLDWYKQSTARIIGGIMPEVVDSLRSHGLKQEPPWSVRSYKRRWGCCHSDGRIVFNLQLASAPGDCIRYVVQHELCHLIRHDHSPAYYRVLSSISPQWKDLKKKLNQTTEIRNL